ncbi:response regulator [Hydrogenophaga sp. 5NK40-0174]|uniref:response regulator n=1 Tax=Hydrogenophaga sp. 5NK40-0174 TaxID=3127649 RepID=UPI003109922D
MNSYDRFVLIDDNEADNVYHEIMIRRAGFTGEILIFYSGIEALEFFRTDALTTRMCIFLDINMPLMSGFEMVEEATPLLTDKPSLLLVMLTSSDNQADKQRAKALSLIKGYVTKPLSVPVIQRLLGGGMPDA